MSAFRDALLLQAGYNAALVAIGAALLGFAAGTVRRSSPCPAPP